MLLLLLLVHQFFTRIRTVQGHSLNSRAPVDSCVDINDCRKLFDIVWGCLTTIFACTWVSVHPNIPPPAQSRLTLLWRRLRMMLIAVIAPELMVGFAARQYLVSRALSKQFKFPRTHGFFFTMGGFVSQTGHPITLVNQLKAPIIGEQSREAICNVTEDDIMDKSKGDALSKGVALAQGLWFTIQCLARVHQRLPVTELEITTLAFAVVNVFIWLLWWDKPLDVEQPIRVGPAEGQQEPGPIIPHMGIAHRFFGVLTGDYSDLYDPISSTSVPSFWAGEQGREDNSFQGALLIECLVGAIFGAIHCAAWNASFPSRDEMWMWRACSLLVAAFPAAIGSVMPVIWAAAEGSFGETIADLIGAVIFILGTPTYIIARLFLIVLPLTTLRTLPPGALTDVNWSIYIPHI
ncbi:hypothetical protein B0H17DRAFT_1047115 [Mycena rosella]|uniref:Uncharacterized protein n=1 Tax=Mycena rosella TaxID=1033263 RepID=A0AAD7DUZ5_MYCRO|nr:hypothetical protein B0H17DRAFT_1047115 [Mycena rosella]